MKHLPWHEIKEEAITLPKPNPNKTDSAAYILINLKGPGREGFIHYASDRLKNDPDFAKDALASNPSLPFSAFSKEVRNSLDVVKFAVSINAAHMRHAGEQAKDDLSVVAAFMTSTSKPADLISSFATKPTDYISPRIASQIFKAVYDPETGEMKQIYQKAATKKLFCTIAEVAQSQTKKLKL